MPVADGSGPDPNKRLEKALESFLLFVRLAAEPPMLLLKLDPVYILLILNYGKI